MKVVGKGRDLGGKEQSLKCEEDVDNSVGGNHFDDFDYLGFDFWSNSHVGRS